MLLLSRRQLTSTLLATVGLMLRGSVTRADHEYVAIVTNTQLGSGGVPGMVGTMLIVEERPASPALLPGCNGVFMPAYRVRVERDRGRQIQLLLGIDTTFHPDASAPAPVVPGDRFVVRKRGSGDCGDGTSLLYLEPVTS